MAKEYLRAYCELVAIYVDVRLWTSWSLNAKAYIKHVAAYNQMPIVAVDKATGYWYIVFDLLFDTLYDEDYLR